MTAKKTYTDPAGDKIPAKYVKPYDRLRDQIANRILAKWQTEEDRLRKIKTETLEMVDRLVTAAAKDAGVKDLGGKAGNIQFRSFDGTITIAVDAAKKTEFDERLALAQQLIMEAVHEIAADAKNADLVEIATKAFQPRRSGNLDMQRIRDLRTYRVSHPKWKKACEIISDCERTIGHRRYIRVSVRQTPDASPINITLDIASL